MTNKLLFFLAILPTWGHGQDTVALGTIPTRPITYTAKNAWHVSALLPSLTYERRIGPQVTLVGEYGLGFLLADPVKTGTGLYGPDFRMNSRIIAGIRRYYDFEYRTKRARSIRYNSSGYVMAKLGYHFAPADRAGNVEFKPGVGPFIQGVLGFQRTYRKNLYLNLATGPQLWYLGLSFGIDAAIGYTLPTSNEQAGER